MPGRSRPASPTESSPLHRTAGVGQMLWNVTAALSRISDAASATQPVAASWVRSISPLLVLQSHSTSTRNDADSALRSVAANQTLAGGVTTGNIRTLEPTI